MTHRFAIALVVVLAAAPASPQTPNLVSPSVTLSQQVRTVPNVVYARASGWEGKLDVYAQRAQAPPPAVIFIHGGGWVQGTKEASVLQLLPYIAMGYNHSVRLQEALQKARVAHELVTIPGGGHGGFAPDPWQRSYAAIQTFLAAHLTGTKTSSSAGK